jgi:hypothetical protein
MENVSFVYENYTYGTGLAMLTFDVFLLYFIGFYLD